MAEQTNSSYKVKLHTSVSTIDRFAWNNMLHPTDSPFLEWEWFYCLEKSGSICEKTGWFARHLCVYECEELIGISPLYIKNHSWGELVFDHQWQNIAAHTANEYFPKLVGMIPATPCESYRFLYRLTDDSTAIIDTIFDAIDQIVAQLAIKVVMFNFIRHDCEYQFRNHGYFPWKQLGFGWKNQGFGSHHEFLQSRSKNFRKNIRKERASLLEAGIVVNAFYGSEVPPHYFSTMNAYYQNTNEQFGVFAAMFLNPQFFDMIRSLFAHRILLCTAHRRTITGGSNADTDSTVDTDVPIGMSFFVHKNDRLYGRYWGASDNISYLHFELCYYFPVEWAINHHISYYDVGVGGTHKIHKGLSADTKIVCMKFIDAPLDSILAENHHKINESLDQIVQGINNKTVS